MLDVIEKLLILQDRDRRILQLEEELARIDPERTSLESSRKAGDEALSSARETAKRLESDRKQLELEVESLKQKITKYTTQQFETKKNEEYQSLGREIDKAKAAIVELDDRQIDLMEQGETAQREVATATSRAEDIRADVDRKITDLEDRRKALEKELDELEAGRESIAGNVDGRALGLYERLLEKKGATAVVGIQHSVCGGCHMKLPTQEIHRARAAQDLVACPNCGRILYHTSDMDLTTSD